jgi:hypothetical protein
MAGGGASHDDLELDQYLETEDLVDSQKHNPFLSDYEQLPSPQSSVTSKRSPYPEQYVLPRSSDASIGDVYSPSPPRKPDLREQIPGSARLVIAVDFGTTYTGRYLSPYRLLMVTDRSAQAWHTVPQPSPMLR